MLAYYKKLNVKPKCAFINLLAFVSVSTLYFVGRSTLSAKNIHPSHRPHKKENIEERAIEWQKTVNNITQQKRFQRLPDVMLVGAEGCGTKGLQNMLRLHPLVKVMTSTNTKYFTANYAKGIQFYKEKMPWATNEQLVLETSPSYFTWPPMMIPQRIKTKLPGVKVIVLLCNPIERTVIDFYEEVDNRPSDISKYEIFLGTYLRKFSTEKLGINLQWDVKMQSTIFNAFTNDYMSHVITSGMYYYHAIRWKAVFDEDHLLFIDKKDMLGNPGLLFQKLQSFLHLPRLLFKNDFVWDNQTRSQCFDPTWTLEGDPPTRQCPLNVVIRELKKQSKPCEESLQNFYSMYNKMLYKLLEKDFGWTF